MTPILSKGLLAEYCTEQLLTFISNTNYTTVHLQVCREVLAHRAKVLLGFIFKASKKGVRHFRKKVERQGSHIKEFTIEF